MMSILVRAEWDAEAGVFVATSDDVPGLITEAATPAELQKKLDVLVPELLELNAEQAPDTSRVSREIPMYVVHELVSKIRIGV
jgi:predicted RNase H-like HicB family nuclease